MAWKVKISETEERREADTLKVLREWTTKGELSKTDLVLHPELGTWNRASDLPELEAAFAERDAAKASWWFRRVATEESFEAGTFLQLREWARKGLILEADLIYDPSKAAWIPYGEAFPELGDTSITPSESEPGSFYEGPGCGFRGLLGLGLMALFVGFVQILGSSQEADSAIFPAVPIWLAVSLAFAFAVYRHSRRVRSLSVLALGLAMPVLVIGASCIAIVKAIEKPTGATSHAVGAAESQTSAKSDQTPPAQKQTDAENKTAAAKRAKSQRSSARPRSSSVSKASFHKVLERHAQEIVESSQRGALRVTEVSRTMSRPMSSFVVKFVTSAPELMSDPTARPGNAAYMRNLGRTQAWQAKFCSVRLKREMAKHKVDIVSGQIEDRSGDMQSAAICGR